MFESVRASLFAAVVLLPVAVAQQGMPEPAPELKKFAPMVGSWAGSGTASMGPGAPTKWTARGSYGWCLDGQFLQEDFEITFEGMSMPMVFRAYYGWDREHGRYVSAIANNAGVAELHEVYWLADGTMMQMMRQHQAGLPYAERTHARVVGEAMQTTIDVLMPEQASTQVVEGTLTRTDTAYTVDWKAKGWQGAMPAPELQQLLRSAGDYDVTGAVVMGPGLPEAKITGTDAFRGVFGDTLFHGSTIGSMEGTPGTYRGEVFWSFDAVRKCLHAVYVSNMGEVMAMDGWWVGDQLVSSFAGTMGGTPLVQQMVMSFDDEGRARDALSRSISGAGAPFESFRAKYTAK